MYDRQHFDLLFLDEIDDPVGTFEHLSYLVNLLLRHHAPGVRESHNLLRTFHQALDNSAPVLRRGSRMVITDRLKLAERRIRPKNSH